MDQGFSCDHFLDLLKNDGTISEMKGSTEQIDSKDIPCISE